MEGPSNHHQGGGPYRVRLDITAPGSELIANKEGEELNAVIRDAFQAAERQLEELADRRRGDVKTRCCRRRGRSSASSRRRASASSPEPDGREVYFHRNAVLEPPGFESLKVGAQVRFAEEQGFEGPQASTVSLVTQGA